MSGAPTPPTLLEAIASAAGGAYITNPLPENPTGTNAASIKGGFPPVTMQEELSGGKPPLGQDFNAYFFLVSSHTLYVECGQLYRYNSDVATAISGYLAGTVLGMADGRGMWLNTADGNTSDPDAGSSAGWVAMASYGFGSIVTSGGTVNLALSQSKYGVIVISGVLSGNLIVNFPQTKQQWLVINGTSGAFSTTLKTAASGSTGQTIAQGGFAAPLGIYSVGDGNIYPAVAPLNLPIDQAPTPLTIVQRTNAGYVLATYFNQNSAIEVFNFASVFAENGDGFLRKLSPFGFGHQLSLSWLSGEAADAQISLSSVLQYAAILHSDTLLTGNARAPTRAVGTSNTQIATTAFANPNQVQANPGRVQFPGGMLVQWGVTHVGNIASGQGTPISGTFAPAFPTACVGVYPSILDTTGLASGFPSVCLTSITSAGFAGFAQESAIGVQDAYVYWLAIGY